MPIVIGVNHEGKQVDAIAIGNVTYADVEDHLLAERHFGGLGYRELIDMRAAAVSWTPNDVNEIVALARSLSRETKFGATAVLVSTDAVFGMIRTLAIRLGDIAEVKPFRVEKEAREWLASRVPQ